MLATRARGTASASPVPARRVARAGEAQSLAVAEADLEHAQRIAPEGGIKITRRTHIVESEARPQGIKCALLRLGEAALAQYEATHLAHPIGDGKRLWWGLCTVAGKWVGQGEALMGKAGGLLSSFSLKCDAAQRVSVMIS